MMEGSIFELGRWGQTEIFLAIAFICLTGLGLTVSWNRGQKYHLPPGPKGWPLLGAIPFLGTIPYQSFLDLSNKFGPIMYMHLGKTPVLVISNAEIAKQVLQTNDRIFASRPNMLIPQYLTYDNQVVAFMPYGPEWRERRKIVTLQLLSSTKLIGFAANLKDEILRCVHTILEESVDKKNVNVNLSSRVAGASMNNVTRMMWSKRYRNIKGEDGANRDEKFVDLIDKWMLITASNNIADFMPSYLQSVTMKLTGLDKKMKDVHQEMDEFLEALVVEKEQASSKGKMGAAAANKSDFFDVLLNLMHEPQESSGLSRDKAKALLLSMLLAGTETNSTTVDWIFAQAMKNPEIMKKLQDELLAVVGKNRLVNESDIPNLKYLDAVVKEGLRKHIVVPLSLPRLAMADSKVAGYDVPANTTVFINVFAIQHDAADWENPMEFNPDRFLQSEVDYKGQSFELLPFGSGRRMCPGIGLAMGFVHLVLAQLIHTIEWSLPDGQLPESVDMSEKPGLTRRRASALFLNARPRLPHHVIYPEVN